MKTLYTNEKNAQILIALLKKHNIRKIIVSPGGTNVTFVASIQTDSFFELYSCVDERSAAYMACGLSAETGEAVVISCTGATASRNYMPGLTEAYYRKLPVLAVTSSQLISRVGHNISQVTDRSSPPKDTVKLSVTLPIVKDENDFWDCEIKINKAILELKRSGGGPAHINIPTMYDANYETSILPEVRKIHRITIKDSFPNLPDGKIAIFIGSHYYMTQEESEVLDTFCASNNAVVFCDHTSGYKGKYRVLYSLAACQLMKDNLAKVNPDLLIHIGEPSGDYFSLLVKGKQVWRISDDGEIRDTYGRLSFVFEMPESVFFKYYSKKKEVNNNYYIECKNHISELLRKIPELPFSNIWIASQLAQKLPEKSVIHFGILNSLRSWNFFEVPKSVMTYSNVGGFGIDGCVSSLIGASFANREKLYFGVIGDLAFFYDINSIGSRFLGNNLRILLVNNGKGTEFKHFMSHASAFGNDTDKYIAAAGHYGNKSESLVKNYTQNLGFEYFAAKNKKEFEEKYKRFLLSSVTDAPMFFEVFTNDVDESDALKKIMNIEQTMKAKTKEITKKVLGDSGVKIVKKVIKR